MRRLLLLREGAARERHARRSCVARTGRDDLEDGFLRLIEEAAMSPRARAPPRAGVRASSAATRGRSCSSWSCRPS